ncbi:hypothetical protein PCASD_06752 [Puccinia coronata f. sp. avenae]|nr:hypothetical protein PCASD_06752 [Puccinia coronata f. sp. avenae]
MNLRQIWKLYQEIVEPFDLSSLCHPIVRPRVSKHVVIFLPFIEPFAIARLEILSIPFSDFAFAMSTVEKADQDA